MLCVAVLLDPFISSTEICTHSLPFYRNVISLDDHPQNAAVNMINPKAEKTEAPGHPHRGHRNETVTKGTSIKTDEDTLRAFNDESNPQEVLRIGPNHLNPDLWRMSALHPNEDSFRCKKNTSIKYLWRFSEGEDIVTVRFYLFSVHRLWCTLAVWPALSWPIRRKEKVKQRRFQKAM